jgi:hypothetical protein
LACDFGMARKPRIRVAMHAPWCFGDLPERVASALSQRQRRLEQMQCIFSYLTHVWFCSVDMLGWLIMQGRPLTQALALHPGQAVGLPFAMARSI